MHYASSIIRSLCAPIVFKRASQLSFSATVSTGLSPVCHVVTFSGKDVPALVRLVPALRPPIVQSLCCDFRGEWYESLSPSQSPSPVASAPVSACSTPSASRSASPVPAAPESKCESQPAAVPSPSDPPDPTASVASQLPVVPSPSADDSDCGFIESKRSCKPSQAAPPLTVCANPFEPLSALDTGDLPAPMPTPESVVYPNGYPKLPPPVIKCPICHVCDRHLMPSCPKLRKKCYACGSEDHLEYACPTKPPRPPDKCYRCGSETHFEYRCPFPRPAKPANA